jgi:hypothetical protein
VILKDATVGYYRNIKLTIVLTASIIIGILISSYPVFSSTVSLTPEEQQWLSEHKTIRVSGPQAFPPFQLLHFGAIFFINADLSSQEHTLSCRFS